MRPLHEDAPWGKVEWVIPAPKRDTIGMTRAQRRELAAMPPLAPIARGVAAPGDIIPAGAWVGNHMVEVESVYSPYISDEDGEVYFGCTPTEAGKPMADKLAAERAAWLARVSAQDHAYDGSAQEAKDKAARDAYDGDGGWRVED